MGKTMRAAVLLVGLSACGGAASGSSAPAPSPAEPPPPPMSAGEPEVDAADAANTTEEATVDEAALAFERAEGELDALLARASVGTDDDRAGKKAPPAPGPTPAQRPTTTPRDLQQAAPPANACHRACRALESMSRSSERLCSLTGEGDPRCENVRERLDRARVVVRQRCASCGE